MLDCGPADAHTLTVTRTQKGITPNVPNGWLQRSQAGEGAPRVVVVVVVLDRSSGTRSEQRPPYLTVTSAHISLEPRSHGEGERRSDPEAPRGDHRPHREIQHPDGWLSHGGSGGADTARSEG